MPLSDNEKSILLECVQKFLDESHQIILFGSYATGKEHPTSDIDIAIKGNKPLDPAKWSFIEEALEESSLTQKVDVVDYWRVKPSFQKVIDRDGIPIKIQPDL